MKTKNLTKWILLLIFTLCSTAVFAGNEPGTEGYIDTWAADDPQHKCPKVTDVNCVSFYISTGPMHNRVNLPEGQIGFLSDLPSPTHSTPQALKVISGLYGIQRVIGNEVTVIDRNQNKVDFVFPEEGAVASPVGADSTWNASLKKVDLDGNLSVTNAVVYELHTYNGLQRIRFSADENSPDYLRMIDLRTNEGQLYRADEFGLSYIYDEGGAIRQVMAPTRLLDFVTIDPYEYEIRCYGPDDVLLGTNGLYEVMEGAVPFEFWTVKNPDGATAYNRLDFTRTVGDTDLTFSFTYVEHQNMWTGTEDGGQTFRQTTMEWDASKENCTRTKKWFSDGESPVSKWTKRIVKQPWGDAIMEVEDHISATLSQTNVYTYYSDASESNRYSKVASVQLGDGTWWTRDYGNQNRVSFETLSWKDVALTTDALAAKEITYDYTSHDSADVLLDFDTRTRTKTETIEGIVTKKTFYTYKTNSVGAQVHITEKCVSQNGSYGDAANSRTTKTYFPPYDGTDFQTRLNSGRLKTEQSSDGQLETYTYALGDLTIDTTNPSSSGFVASTNGFDWQVTKTLGTVDNPDGIANKTTQTVTVKDARSNTALSETYVYTGSGYERIKWTVKEFDVYGHALNTWISDGTQESGVWGTGCCGKDSGTDRQGVKTTYTYDLNKRLMSATKLKADDTTAFSMEYSYDAKGRRLSTTRSASGVTSLAHSGSYDMLGRRLQEVAENATVTTWDHNASGLVVTNTLPGGSTRIAAKYADGKIKSITGTAVVHEAVEYGVNSDGTQWTIKYTGSDGTSSPMWEKHTRDLLGRVVKTEKPGFGGETLTTKYTNNTKGQLTKTEQWVGAELETVQIMEYDDLGNRVRSGTDVDQNGSLTLASMDRISDTVRGYVKEDGDWYDQTVQIFYPQDNSAVALTNSIVRSRLTGLTGGPESSQTDRFGQTITSSEILYRDYRFAIQGTTLPGSTSPATKIYANGLLVQSVDSKQVSQTFEYDALERRTAVRSSSDGGSRSTATSAHYNDLGQVDYTEDAASNKTWIAYDPDTGRKTAITNALNQTTLYEYNDRGQVDTVGGSSQYPVQYDYDDVGRMTDLYTMRSATSGWDHTQWLYDAATGVMTNKLYDDGKGPSYTYTRDLKLETRNWARGSSTTYSYDSLGSLTNMVYSDSTPSVSIAYNRLGQKTQIIDAAGTNTFAYSDSLQLTNEFNVGQASSLSRLYDDLGRAEGASLGDDYAVSYGYDTYGRFSSVTSSVPGIADTVFDYSYLPGSSLVSGYSTAGVSPALSVSYGFEENRNAKTQVLNKFGTNLVSSFDYIYDDLMRRTQRTDVSGQGSEVSTNDFGYNNRSELTDADMGADVYDYDYDLIGNRTECSVGSVSQSYVANELNQYTTITNGGAGSPSTLTYDDDGNLTNDGINTYYWTGENRLWWVVPDSPTNGSVTVGFAYDHRGRRISKQVYTRISDVWSQTSDLRFVYDGWNLIADICSPTSGTSSTNLFVWGLDLSGSLQGAGGVGGLLAMIPSTGGVAEGRGGFFPCYDANGNVTDYVSTNGTVVAHYEYDAYGNTTVATGPMVDDFAFRFSTKYFDAETGLSYYGYRYYLSGQGRWLNRDPLEEWGGLNIYGFALNDV